MKLNNNTKLKSSLFIFSMMVLSFGQVEAQMVVQKWHHGRQAALSLTYDDGTKSHYTELRPILNKYNLKGTFYLNTSLLSDHPVEDAHSGSWDEFKIMADEGHELGSHGVNHPDLTTLPTGDSLTENTIDYELYQSKKAIEQQIGAGYLCLTHAYPFCTNNATVREITARYYESARTCGSIFNSSSPNYMTLNCQLYDWPAVRNSFIDDFHLLNTFFNSVETSVIGQGGWGILLCHEVLPFVEAKTAGTWEPTSSEWMIEASKWLCKTADEGKLWIGTVADVTRYAKERDAFYFQKLTEKEDTIAFFVGDSLDNSVFDFPLSVNIEVPSTWEMVKVVQKNNVQNYSSTNDVNPVIKAQIIPLEDTVYLVKLPDNQLVINSAAVMESGNEILIRFNSPVNITDTTNTGIAVSLNRTSTAEITGFSYTGTDSLEVKLHLADSIYAGELVNLSIKDSEIYSTDISQLIDVTSIPVRNNSKLVEDEYRVLAVSTGIIAQDDQSADIDFYVFSTSGFNLDLESTWAAVSKTTGFEYDTIQVHFDENLTGSDRADTIFIYTEDGFQEKIILSQYVQKLARLRITPSWTTRNVGDTVFFQAFHYDQFDQLFTGNYPDVTWRVEGSGSLYMETDTSVYFICEVPADTSYLEVSYNGDFATQSRIITRPYATGITERVKPGNFIIYPNPGDDVINIRANSEEEPIYVDIFDLKGALLLQQKFSPVVGQHVFSLKISDLASGIYIIKINYSQGVYTEQLLVDKR